MAIKLNVVANSSIAGFSVKFPEEGIEPKDLLRVEEFMKSIGVDKNVADTEGSVDIVKFFTAIRIGKLPWAQVDCYFGGEDRANLICEKLNEILAKE